MIKIKILKRKKGLICPPATQDLELNTKNDKAVWLGKLRNLFIKIRNCCFLGHKQLFTHQNATKAPNHFWAAAQMSGICF